jgi:ABC-type polysaccharide/polyol phosphate export permease
MALTRLPLVRSLTELPEYRHVLYSLVARDLKVRYQTKALGFVWSLLDPAITLGIWYVIFNRVIRLPIGHYWAFLIAGLIPFRFFTSGIIDVSSSIRRNAGIIRKVYLPMEILVISAVAVKLFEFLLQLLLAIVLLWALHHGTKPDPTTGIVPVFSLTKTLVVVPGAVTVLSLLVIGIGMPLAAWSVIYRDLDHIVDVAMTTLLYLTPVFWSLLLIPGTPRWKHLFALNPAADIIDLFRAPLYWGTWPVNTALGGGAWVAWGVPLAMCLVVLVVGHLMFDRCKRILAEVV